MIMCSYHSKKELVNAIKEQITSRNDRAIKAMLSIYDYQTNEEKVIGVNREFNGVGFAGTDVNILSSFCEQYIKKGYLSPKQMELLKKRIGKYANQLTENAIARGIYKKVEGYWVVNK